MPSGFRGRPTWQTDVAAILVAAVWGSSYLATKAVVTGRTVVVLVLLRFLISLPILGASALPRIRDLSRRELDAGLLLGLILAGEFLLETYGVAHTSATNAGLIVSCTMIFTPLVESLLTRTRPSGSFLAAATACVVGVALLTQGNGFTMPSAGDLLMLLAALTRTGYVVAVHRVAANRRADDAALTFVQFSAVAIVMIVAAPYTGVTAWGIAANLDGRQWLLLLYLALVCTLLAFFVQIWAVRRSSPSRVSLLLGTEPVWAAVTGIAVGGDRLGISGAVGVVLILAGVLTGRRPHPPRRTADPGTDAPPSAPQTASAAAIRQMMTPDPHPPTVARRPPYAAVALPGGRGGLVMADAGATPASSPYSARPTHLGELGTAWPMTGQNRDWCLTVSADADYFAAVMAASGVQSQSLVFPANHHERSFALTTPQVRIGRRHFFDSPGPEIDLSGSPRDPGISRDHAVLLSTHDGWAIVDQGSTNGVLVDGVPAPPFVPVAVEDGTRIHIGVWTILTLSRKSPGTAYSCRLTGWPEGPAV